jgi:hypothetical protein
MEMMADNVGMELAMIIFLLVVGPLAVLFGADSRISDTRDKRRWI